MSLHSLCIWQVQVSVNCAWRIPAHLGYTQCSILLHLMDLCSLTCICLWQISQIQTFLFKVVGPGLVTTSQQQQRHPSSGSAWTACPKNGKSGRFDTICTAARVRCDSSTACRLCRLEPHLFVYRACPTTLTHTVRLMEVNQD